MLRNGLVCDSHLMIKCKNAKLTLYLHKTVQKGLMIVYVDKEKQQMFIILLN